MKKTKNVIGPPAISHAVLSQCLEQVRNQIVLAQRSSSCHFLGLGKRHH